MQLNINTPRGLHSQRHEQELISALSIKWPNLSWVDTPKNMPASVDGLWINKHGSVHAVVEIKCRDMTEDLFLGRYNGEWLITAAKLKQGCTAAVLLGAPFYAYLALVPDGVLYYRKISNGHGKHLANWREEETTTPRNINGGCVERVNAFLPMQQGTRIHYRRSKVSDYYGHSSGA